MTAVSAIVLVSLCACSDKGVESKTAPEGKAIATDSTLSFITVKREVFHGIPAQVLYRLPKKADSEKLIEIGIDKAFAKIGEHFNIFKSGTEVRGINRKDGPTEHTLSPEMAEAMRISANIYKQSEGAFDPTIGPFKKLWSEAKNAQVLPSSEALRQASAIVGWNKVSFKDEARPAYKRTAGMTLDFGGLAKGLAVDWISDLLKREKVTDALVQCGGEIRSWGKNKNGSPWSIGIQHPLEMNSLHGKLKLPDETAVSTSGNYRQPIKIGDTTYYHIFNPANGKPTSTDILGVTVMMKASKTANAQADAWATAMTVLGAEKGLDVAKSNGVDVLFLLKSPEGAAKIRAVMTEGMRKVFSPPTVESVAD